LEACMARTALNAPAHRVLQTIGTGYPPGAAPNIDYLGIGLQDHRLPWNTANSSTGAQVVGWYGSDPVIVLNQVPSTLATANIAALANVTSGTAMTLVSSSGAGITVLSAATTFFPSLNAVPANACVIDVTPALKTFGTGTAGRTAFYDRTTMIGRALSITGLAGGAGGAWAHGLAIGGVAAACTAVIATAASLAGRRSAVVAVCTVICPRI
jgi:hypothetical protein